MNLEDTEASQLEYERVTSVTLIDWALLPYFTGERGLCCGHSEEAVGAGEDLLCPSSMSSHSVCHTGSDSILKAD